MVQFTTVLPDVASGDITPVGASVEDELTVPTPGVSNYGDVRMQIRVSGSGNSFGSDIVHPHDGSDFTFQNLADGEQYDIRARTETEHVTGTYVTVSEVTLLPADTGLAATNREDTVDISVTDEADNEDGRRLQRSTDGGGSWTTVADVGANTTSLTDGDPPLYQEVLYRTQVYTEHTVANSSTITVVPVRTAEVNVELTFSGTTTVLAPDDLAAVSVSPEHTAIWGATLTVAPADRDALDYVAYETAVYYGSQQFFDGTTRVGAVESGTARLQGYGKATDLEADTSFVAYPDAITTTTGVPVHDAIADYWGRTPAAGTATVHDASVTTVRTDETVVDTTAGQDFVSEFDNDTKPFAYDTGADEIFLAQSNFAPEVEDMSGSGTVVDGAGTGEDYSEFEAVEFTTPGQERDATVTIDYTIPAGNVAAQLRVSYQGWEGTVALIIDGTQVGEIGQPSPATQAPQWRDMTAGLSADLSGSTTITLQAQNSVDGVWNGSVRLDIVSVYDDRYSYTFDNDPNESGDYELSGPEPLPDRASIQGTAQEQVWHIPEATQTITVDDASLVGLGLRVGSSAVFQQTFDTTSHTVDFDAVGQVGGTLDHQLIMERGDESGLITTPTDGTKSPTVSAYQLDVDTDDLPFISGANPVTLEGDTHLANLQDLHETGDFRFVMDHQQAGLVVESFRRGDPDVVKAADWQATADGVTEERDVLDYANRVRVQGDGESVELIQTAAVNSFGTDVIDSLSRPSISAHDELVDEARQALIERTGNDEFSGTVPIAPHLVLPGYPYSVPEFGGDQANLNSVTFELAGSDSRGQLQFGRRRTLAAKVADRE